MEIRLSPDLETRITRIAAEQGRDANALITEAVERFLSYDEWFLREVEKGLAAADRGEFVEHDEIVRRISTRYPD